MLWPRVRTGMRLVAARYEAAAKRPGGAGLDRGNQMSSMPERDTPGQPGGSTEQSARPGERGAPNQGSAPGQEQLAGVPAGSIPGQPEAGQPGGQQSGWGGQPAMTPVSETETRV